MIKRRLARATLALRSGLALLLATAALTGDVACKRATADAETQAGEAETLGSWNDWLVLNPLSETASTHAPEPVAKAIAGASKLLQDRKALTAYKALDELSASEGRHWITAARADLAALYFTVCIRGVAWRLEDITDETSASRRADFSEETKVGPGDVSVEGLLGDLDAAVIAGAKIPALANQARIARARVAAYVNRCPANEEVARKSEEVLKSDLATLAAEGALTPDLSYMWGGIQYAEYSAAAAKPFLLQARESGFQDPSVVYLLAVIALEQRDFTKADAYAVEAIAAYSELKDPAQEAQAHFIRGEVARASKKLKAAAQHYKKAQALIPDHVAAILGETRLVLDTQGESAAIAMLKGRLGKLTPPGPANEGRARATASNLEALVVMAEEPEFAAVARAALLEEVEDDGDALRRGLRYFYAATLDARLGEYQHARSHAILARDEFETLAEAEDDDGTGLGLVQQVNAFLDQVAAG